MPWMCLQRCNETVEDIEANLKQLQDLRPCLAAVSFELYNLGPNATLITNSDLYSVGPTIRDMGLETYPMISSFPYPPAFLEWMRTLWNDQHAGMSFIAQLRSEAQRHGWSGFQVDWEPTAKATPQDAANYASYLGLMARTLSPIRIIPTVATWNSIWNLALIAKAQTFRVVTMSTYAKNYTTFSSSLQNALLYISKESLGVGVETWPVMDDDFAKRIALMKALGIRELDVWKSPIPDDWIAPLKDFAGCA